MRRISFLALLAAALTFGAAGSIASAQVPAISQIGAHERGFDYRRDLFKTALRSLSPKPSDIASLDVGKWLTTVLDDSDNLGVPAGDLQYDYGELTKEANQTCDGYVLALEGTDKNHGWSRLRDEYQAIATLLKTTIDDLKGGEHYLETQLLTGHLSGRDVSTINQKLKAIRDAIHNLQNDLDYNFTKTARGYGQSVTEVRSKLQAKKCPGYVAAATPTPAPTKTPPTPPPAQKTPKPASKEAQPTATPPPAPGSPLVGTWREQYGTRTVTFYQNGAGTISGKGRYAPYAGIEQTLGNCRFDAQTIGFICDATGSWTTPSTQCTLSGPVRLHSIDGFKQWASWEQTVVKTTYQKKGSDACPAPGNVESFTLQRR